MMIYVQLMLNVYFIIVMLIPKLFETFGKVEQRVELAAVPRRMIKCDFIVHDEEEFDCGRQCKNCRCSTLPVSGGLLSAARTRCLEDCDASVTGEPVQKCSDKLSQHFY